MDLGTVTLQRPLPFQSNFPPEAKHTISSSELFKVALPFSTDEKTKYEPKGKKKVSVMERRVAERDRLGMELGAGEEMTASLLSHRDGDGLGYQR